MYIIAFSECCTYSTDLQATWLKGLSTTDVTTDTRYSLITVSDCATEYLSVKVAKPTVDDSIDTAEQRIDFVTDGEYNAVIYTVNHMLLSEAELNYLISNDQHQQIDPRSPTFYKFKWDCQHTP